MFTIFKLASFFVLEVTVIDANRLCQRQSGSNLETKWKRLSIVFTKFLTAKQGAGRAERTEGIDRDYATGADGTEKGQSGTPVPTKREEQVPPLPRPVRKNSKNAYLILYYDWKENW